MWHALCKSISQERIYNKESVRIWNRMLRFCALAGTFYLDEIEPSQCHGRALARDGGSGDARVYPAISVCTRSELSEPIQQWYGDSFRAAGGGETELAVYNLVGQKIASLVHGAREVGQYTVHWDGRDSSREPLASGWDQVETRKLLLLR